MLPLRSSISPFTSCIYLLFNGLIIYNALCTTWNIVTSTSRQQALHEISELSQETHNRDDFRLAIQESAGFFDDIRKDDWQLMKERIRSTPNCAKDCAPEAPTSWYQNNWEPALNCQHERRIGLWGDGGKWVCDPHRIMKKSNKSCLVYSVGFNNEFSFEQNVLEKISPECEIHTFDPTVGDTPNNLPTHGKIFFHPWGLADKNQESYKTLPTIIKELNHTGKEIDLLKIDCEDCEFQTFITWFDNSTLIRQILLEIHKGTEDVATPPAQEIMLLLQREGYVIFHKEPNIQFQSGGLCIEYSFLRLSPELNKYKDESTKFWWILDVDMS